MTEHQNPVVGDTVRHNNGNLAEVRPLEEWILCVRISKRNTCVGQPRSSRSTDH